MFAGAFIGIVLVSYIMAGVLCNMRHENYFGDSKFDRLTAIVFFPLVYLCVHIDKKENEKRVNDLITRKR